MSLKGLRVDKQTPHLHAIVFDVFALFCDIIIKQVLNLSAHTRIYIKIVHVNWIIMMDGCPFILSLSPLKWTNTK